MAQAGHAVFLHVQNNNGNVALDACPRVGFARISCNIAFSAVGGWVAEKSSAANWKPIMPMRMTCWRAGAVASVSWGSICS